MAMGGNEGQLGANSDLKVIKGSLSGPWMHEVSQMMTIMMMMMRTMMMVMNNDAYDARPKFLTE